MSETITVLCLQFSLRQLLLIQYFLCACLCCFYLHCVLVMVLHAKKICIYYWIWILRYLRYDITKEIYS